jgi:hypothetical protein
LGIGGKNATHKLLRIDLKKAKVFEYTPLIAGDLPLDAFALLVPLSPCLLFPLS